MAKLSFMMMAIASALVNAESFAACGDRGGPGYRGPNGKCVGWAELARVCGSPPTSKCAAETVATGSKEAAVHGAEIETLRSSSAKSK